MNDLIKELGVPKIQPTHLSKRSIRMTRLNNKIKISNMEEN